MACYNSCVIDKPVVEIWALLRKFHDLSWAVDVVESVEVVGEKKADQLGAGRIINGAFHETLVELDDEDYLLVYSIDDGPGPMEGRAVKGYRGLIQLSPITIGGGTFVEWSSSWRNDVDGVFELCDPIYKALLGALVKHYA